MRKKYLLSVICLIIVFIIFFAFHQRNRGQKTNEAVTVAQQRSDSLDRLLALPYLQGYHKAPQQTNITIYDKDRAWHGLNLYSSGHANEAAIMDMEGTILHKWEYDIRKAWPDERIYKGYKGSTHWRRVHVYPNGDLLAIYEKIGLIKLDKNSNLVWSFRKRRPHHHMQVDDSGTIFVLTAKKYFIPSINKSEYVFVDFITLLSPDAEIIDELSLLQAFQNSPYAFILNNMPRRGELFHTNTIQVFDGTLSHISPLFRKGNVLIASLYLNSIAIVDLDTRRVVWALCGSDNTMWQGVHEPIVLKNGNILIFDNDWNETDTGKSEVIEFDFFTREIVWRYGGDEKHPFHSNTLGTNQKLPNGNVLITESDKGRVFEVTKEGRIVWEYVNPHRAGTENELIATLLHVQRYPPDTFEWLSKSR
jgi:hypothetical protein